MTRPNLNTTSNILGALILSMATMGVKYLFDQAMQVNSRFLFSTLCVAVCAFLFSHIGGYTSAILNLIGQILFYKFRQHVNSNLTVDGTVVLTTFAITAILIVYVINRALTAHLVSMAAIKSLNVERAISIELRNVLEGAVDAVVEPLYIFNPVHNELGEVIDFQIRYTNSAEPFLLLDEALTARQIIGKNITAIAPQIIESGLLGKLLAVYATGQSIEAESSIPTDQGMRLYQITAKRVGTTLVAQWRKHMQVSIPAA